MLYGPGLGPVRLQISPRPPDRRRGAQEARSKRGAAAGWPCSRVSCHSIRRQASSSAKYSPGSPLGYIVFVEAETPDPGPRLAGQGEDHLKRRTTALEEVAILCEVGHALEHVQRSWFEFDPVRMVGVPTTCCQRRAARVGANSR